MSGLPSIFARDEEMLLFQEYVAEALGVPNAASDVLIVGSAKTGFSLDPDNYFVPFRETSDIDIVVVHEGLFDEAWHTMLAWDYLTIKNRTKPEQQWLYERHDDVWSGWYDPPGWHLRERGGIELSFPSVLKPLREFSFRWFSAFRSLSRYKHHPEISRHKASARLYRTRAHVAMYHAVGLRALRNRLSSSECQMRFESGTQTISWFQKEYKEGTIILRPPYQRKPVWAARQKCYLIESILYELPIPEIFIHETTTAEGETLHAVVDGQQRIRTVLQFLGLTTLAPDGEPEPEEEEFTGFTLDKFDKLPESSPWLGKRFADLTKDERIKFFGYKFHIRYLYTSDEAELRTMFTRLNRYLTALNAQELRHATYTGPFAKLAEELADSEYWLKAGLMTRALIRRLGDVDFVSQLLIGVIHGPEGGSPSVVDEYYRQYEDYDLEEGIPDQRRARRLFDQTLKFIQGLFPDLQKSPELRWGNRADFYSLFVALADVIREHDTSKAECVPRFRGVLEEFSKAVNRRLANEDAVVPANVIGYVRAIEKGVNEKARRADRHHILVALIKKTLNLESADEPHKLPRRKRERKSI